MTNTRTDADSRANLLSSAIEFASRAHAGQTRKDGRTPYVVHPIGVMRRLSTDLQVTDKEILAAAVLHDVLEDTPTDPEELGRKFGTRILGMVRELSLPASVHGPGVADEAKTQAILRALGAMSWEAVVVKLCDRLDNLGDIESTAWSESKRQNYRNGSLDIAETVERRLAVRPPTGLLAEQIRRGAAMLRRAGDSGNQPAQELLTEDR